MDGMKLHDVARTLHVHVLTVRQWVVDLGGTIRPQHGREGYVERQIWDCKSTIGGSWYCAGYCDWAPGKCEQEATVQDLAAKAKIEAERERVAENDEERERERAEMSNTRIRSYQTRAF
jgi:hypothetical protein